MINILIPLAGKSIFFDSDEYIYPKQLIEINGKPMIELVLENFLKIKEKKRFIFVVNKVDCNRFHFDNTLNLLTENNCEIIKLSGETKGAACSCLMAIDCIDNNDNIIISNGDQVIDVDFKSILSYFYKNHYDAGVICFEAVHPNWSYVRINNLSKIIEVAEKKPFSKNAIAGFYYFKRGSYFVKTAMKSIENNDNVNGKFYIAPVLNELILENKNLGMFKIESSKYHSFYSPKKIIDYESSHSKNNFLQE